jgi:hypothetical protein
VLDALLIEQHVLSLRLLLLVLQWCLQADLVLQVAGTSAPLAVLLLAVLLFLVSRLQQTTGNNGSKHEEQRARLFGFPHSKDSQHSHVPPAINCNTDAIALPLQCTGLSPIAPAVEDDAIRT